MGEERAWGRPVPTIANDKCDASAQGVVAWREIMNRKFVVTETTTSADVAAAGRPDPLYCRPGLVQHARYLADLIDAEIGGETSCGGAGIGYVPDVLELEEETDSRR